MKAFFLGLFDSLRYPGSHGHTWDQDQDANEHYDQGVNVAEAFRSILRLRRKWK